MAAQFTGKPWPLHTIDKSARGADGVKLIDINTDGRPDVATAWEEDGLIRVYYNEGRVGVRSPWPNVTVGRVRAPEDAVFADLDGDLGFDVVSACEGNQRALFVHWAPKDFDRYFDPAAWTTGAIAASQNRMMWMFAVPMQVDGRHGPDLVAGGKGPGAEIGWMEAPAHPRDLTAWRWHRLRPAGWIMSILTLDMDADGDLDILFSDRRGNRSGIFWLENPGSTAARADQPWKEHPIGSQGREVMFLDVADFDGDGRHDIIAAVKPRETQIHRRLGKDGRGWATQSIAWPVTVGTAKAIRAADINNDGHVDLIYSAEQATGDLRGVAWMNLRNQAIHDISGAPGVKYDAMELYDFDADGDLDILTTEETDGLGVVWYENPL